jgi:LPS export ABC transporter permease LptG
MMLRLVDRYVFREIVPYFLLSLLLLTAIVFAHDGSRFSEMLVVSSRQGLPMQALWRVMAALVPGILVFTLPISLLVGTLVGLSRLSGDSEIVALGASGVSRTRVLKPVVAMGLVVAALMVYLTVNVLPRSVRNLTDLKNNQSLVLQGLNTQIKPRVFEESIPKKVLYVEDIDRANNIWHNIFLVDMSQEQAGMKILTAESGSLRQGSRSDAPELFLQRGAVHQFSGPKGAQAVEDDQLIAPDADSEQPAEPEQPCPRKERKKSRVQPYSVLGFSDFTLGLEMTDGRKDEGVGLAERPRAVREMEWSDLTSYEPPIEDYREWRAEIHKRLALPAACLVFALLGVGFGISNVRTGRPFGLLLGLAITILFYLLALSGEHAAVSGKLPVWLGMWMANMLLTLVGALVILVQRRPGSDALGILSSLRHAWPSHRGRAGLGRKEGEYVQELPAYVKGDEPTPSPRPSLAASSGYLRPLLIDRLVLSDLSRFFLFILGGFSALFIIITLFQLLDYITRNKIEWQVVASYLIFLLPWIVNNVAPPAALVAVMVTFGILQKTSQVVAVKASGQSIYRLGLPALASSLLLAGFVYLNQDYILPFTNPRQNSLRYLIRKGQEPPQTFYQTNQWIFGSESRLYNYAHFEPTNNVFVQFNVLDLDREPFSIKARLYARRARWDRGTREWVLENGWERRFSGDKTVAFEPFGERRVTLPEDPEHFKRDMRGSSSLTLAELRRRIVDLSAAGFDVVDLRIALQGKIAFPLTCLIMVMVGLPFSFSVGKRGALYGVTIGIGLGLAYWGLLGLFEQMGRYELLPPMLAAWGPNILFGSGGLYLLLKSRT